MASIGGPTGELDRESDAARFERLEGTGRFGGGGGAARAGERAAEDGRGGGRGGTARPAAGLLGGSGRLGKTGGPADAGMSGTKEEDSRVSKGRLAISEHEEDVHGLRGGLTTPSSDAPVPDPTPIPPVLAGRLGALGLGGTRGGSGRIGELVALTGGALRGNVGVGRDGVGGSTGVDGTDAPGRGGGARGGGRAR